MTLPELLRIVAGSIHPGRCRDCRRRVTWATVAPRHGQRARTLPFNGRPVTLSIERNPETHVVFEIWPNDLFHAATCPKRRKRSDERHAARGAV